MWKCASIVFIYQHRKCGHVEKCVFIANSGNVSGMIWELKIGLARGEMTGVTSDCCQSQDGDIASFSSPPGRIFL